jgi:diguanylate cyclase (GGDEF)-like protein
MTMNEISIVIFAEPRSPLRRWLEAAQNEGFRLLEATQLSHASCELVITNRLQRDDWPEPLRLAQLRGDVGVVQIGGRTGGDVLLPGDCTERELLLTCRLLSEIVRLRRRLRKRRGNEKTLRRLAFEDALTGLANRRCWERELAAMAQAAGADQTLIVALLDVDQFKQLNDGEGHPVADRALAAAADALRGAVRHGDFVARIGGDEFGLLLIDASAHAAAAIVERIRENAGAAARGCSQSPLTLSAGLAAGPTGRVLALVDAADAALRQAKQDGRNRTVARNLQP